MSGRLRTLKNRIRSVENTKKITRAMEMVAAAKLRRVQDMMLKGRAYVDALENLLKRLSQAAQESGHPFFAQREEKNIAVALLTSDSGLCGSYNLGLIATAQDFLAKQKSPALLCGVGKMGIQAMKRLGLAPAKALTDIRISQVEETIQQLKAFLEESFLSERADSVYVIYNQCLSSASYQETVRRVLPLEIPRKVGEGLKPAPTEKFWMAEEVPYIFEPDKPTLLKRIIPLFFEARVRQIFLESFVSEQIARMQAMHQATENAGEMIDELVLERNKVRQAAITKEIIEIVSGSQALKK